MPSFSQPFAILISKRRALGLLLACLFSLGAATAARIKEVASIEGVRSNQLTGFGLVVGLDGTGDQTTQMPYTSQGLNNYLQQLGITLPAASVSQLQLKNVAAVLVTAQLPAFARPGQTLDVNVSSLGNSKSLKGGMLITTPLKRRRGSLRISAG
jgi:flagellar P-ring protein FlgI